MVSQCVFYKRASDKTAANGIPSRQARFEETRSNDIEASNKTLSWVFAMDPPPVYSYDEMAKSLYRYYGEFEGYQLTPSLEKKILKAAAIMTPAFQKLGIFAITPTELREVAGIAVSYMLLNELELLFLVTSIDRICQNEVILTLSQKALESCEQGYVFEKERIFKKSHAFLLSLILCFFLAMIVKENLGAPMDVEMFSNVFFHLLSPDMREHYMKFKEDNPKIGSFNLIELNDTSRKLDSDETSLKFFFGEGNQSSAISKPSCCSGCCDIGHHHDQKRLCLEEVENLSSFHPGRKSEAESSPFDLLDEYIG